MQCKSYIWKLTRQRRFSQMPGSQQPVAQLGSYTQYPSREAQQARPSSFYGQDYPSDYLSSQQRMISSVAHASSTSQGGGWLSGFQQSPPFQPTQQSQSSYGRTSGLQYPYRESEGSYNYNQGMNPQGRQMSQFPQPVPPERQLPSSGTGQYDQQTYDQPPRQDSYASSQSYQQGYGDRRAAYGQSQDPAAIQDAYPQLPSRTLPAPPSSNASLLSTTSSAGQPYFQFSGAQQAGGSNTTSSGYGAGTGGYPYGSYQGQQGYR